MIVIEQTSLIEAPPQVCFDLARDVDFHVESMKATGEKVVAGKMSGLLELRDTMTLEAKQFGIKFRMTAKITEMDPPHRFVDEMVSGPFKSLWHSHVFEESDGLTRMTDVMKVVPPFGVIGGLVVRRQLSAVLARRHEHIKQRAELLAQK